MILKETLHILPHWNWEGREGEKTPVFVYTNYDRAELFVNDKSQGIQIKNDSTPQTRYRLMWNDVIYEPGTLKVIAYTQDGSVAAEKTVETAGKPYAIQLEADRKTITADGNDLSFVTVSVVDKEGNICPTATNRLNFKVTGNGEFKAVANGDPTSLEAFHKPTMKLFSGKLVVLVQSDTISGNIRLKVSGTSLKSAVLKLKSTPIN